MDLNVSLSGMPLLNKGLNRQRERLSTEETDAQRKTKWISSWCGGWMEIRKIMEEFVEGNLDGDRHEQPWMSHITCSHLHICTGTMSQATFSV